MDEKNLTVRIHHSVRIEARCRKWPGRMWQRIRMALGFSLLRPEPFHTYDSSLTEYSIVYKELCNIATCNKFRKEDIEITTTRQETSPTETVVTLTLLNQKQQVCQVELRTEWSNGGA